MAIKSDFAERLSQSRIKAGLRSPREAAQKFGWNENTYKSRENGLRGVPDQDEVRRYARAFEVPFLWLLTGEDVDGRFVVSVMGKIGAGASILPEMEQMPPHGLYEIETLIPIPEGSVAFEVDGESMWPRYDQGDIIVCWRQGSDVEQVVGWEAAVRTDDGHRYLKRILRGAERGTFDLESHNAPPIRSVKLEWVAQVHAVIRADMWRSTVSGRGKKVGATIKRQMRLAK